MDNFKNRLADACRANGFGDIAAALDTSTREDPESAARIVAQNIQAAIDKGLAADPLMRAVKASGIDTPEAMGAFASIHAIGNRHIAELRAETQREAIRAYGEEMGPRLSAGVPHLPYEAVRDLRDQFKAHADTTFGTSSTKPGERRSASGGTMPNAQDVGGQGDRPFNRLDPDTQAAIKATAGTDEARQDRMASEFLNRTEVN